MAIKLNNKEYGKVDYDNDLNPRQQENYNFAKISAILADYGFTTMRLTSDWQGADFIAQHKDGKTFIKVQLKSRLDFREQYKDKDLYVAFCCEDDWYLYPHDELLELDQVARNHVKRRGGYSCRRPSQKALRILKPYKIP